MKRGSMSHDDTEQLVRLAVDDQLSPEQVATLEARLNAGDDDLRSALEAERGLKSAVARVMIEPASAPAGLADEIRAAIAAEEAPDDDVLHRKSAAVALDDGVAGRITPAKAEVATTATAASSEQRSRRRWFPRWAMAAGITLLVGASVVIGLLGDALPGSFGLGGKAELIRDRGQQQQPGSADSTAAMLTAEQERASLALVESEWRAHRMLTLADHAREFIRQNLELDFEIQDFRAFGYRFDGLAATRIADPVLGSTDLMIDLRYVPVRTMPGTEPADVIHHWTYADGVHSSVLADLQDAARPRVAGKPYLIELEAVVSDSSADASVAAGLQPGTNSTTTTTAYFAWIDPATRLEKWLGPAEVPGAHTMAIHAGMPGGPVTRIALDDR